MNEIEIQIPIPTRVVRRSPLSDEINEMIIMISPDQAARFARREELVQDIFPELSDDEREFIISGITPDEWAHIVALEEDL